MIYRQTNLRDWVGTKTKHCGEGEDGLKLHGDGHGWD